MQTFEFVFATDMRKSVKMKGEGLNVDQARQRAWFKVLEKNKRKNPSCLGFRFRLIVRNG